VIFIPLPPFELPPDPPLDTLLALYDLVGGAAYPCDPAGLD
jgi:hypothetical protein